MPQKIPDGMAQCANCKWIYPSTLVNLFRSSAPDLNGRPVCGICGLELTNMVHGSNRKSFDGEIAEFMRLSAIEWRLKHPYDNPMRRGKRLTQEQAEKLSDSIGNAMLYPPKEDKK